MDDITKKIEDYFDSVSATLDNLEKTKIIDFISMLLELYKDSGTIFTFGNGGSGATASHLCGDFIKGISYSRKKRFKAVCLNDNIPAMMAVANDISYDEIFVEQLKNFLTDKDLVIGISGSGNSINVVKALEYAKGSGAKTVAFCGFDGGRIKDIAHLAIHADINDMEISEDIHIIVTHCVKQILIDILDNLVD